LSEAKGMVIKMENSVIKKMSMIERLQTMEALWDSIIYEGLRIESPEWHREIIEERKREMKNGKAEFISIDKLKAMNK